jgi:hypothetical protein
LKTWSILSKSLRRAKYVIWIGRQESQGIALQEAMSMNVPILVWDVNNIGQWDPKGKQKKIFNSFESEYTETTSAYYFDKNCGIKTRDKNSMSNNIMEMEKTWSTYNPRDYIIDNLSLKKQAVEFVNLFERHFNIKFKDGLSEIPRNSKTWVNKNRLNVFFYKAKSLLKSIL